MSMRWPGVGLAGLADERLAPEAGALPLTPETGLPPEVGVTIGATGASALRESERVSEGEKEIESESERERERDR